MSNAIPIHGRHKNDPNYVHNEIGGYMQGLSLSEIQTAVDERRDAFLERAIERLPGTRLTGEAQTSVEAALRTIGADYVATRREAIVPHEAKDVKAILRNVYRLQEAADKADQAKVAQAVEALLDGNPAFSEVPNHAFTLREDTNKVFLPVSSTYPVIQHGEAFQAAEILCDQGKATLVAIDDRDNGTIRLTALIAATELPQHDGVDVIAHFAVFESGLGMASDKYFLLTLRCRCLNGITTRTRARAAMHTIRHTKHARKRLEGFTEGILRSLMKDVDAERALFDNLIKKQLTRDAFEADIVEKWLEPLAEDAGDIAKRNREDAKRRLREIWDGGCEGLAPENAKESSAWHGLNVITRFMEEQQERITDWKRQTARFYSNDTGTGQAKRLKAVKLLQRRDGGVERA